MLWSALLVLTTGCIHHVNVPSETQALLETDRAWAREASASRNADSVLAFWTDDARVVMAGEPTRDGKSAIRQMVVSSLAIPGFHITWIPERAEVAASGDLGYTVGTNEFTIPDAAGKLTTYPGRYITVWRRGADGRWRCVQDYSTPSATGAP
jgi:uncharacterized protein (TIGR02246 family)